MFIRCYNKSKEVIELGYKQFFVNIWYDCGLISQYDKFLLEKSFVYGKYDAVQKARCAWYMCYGENPAIKLDILHLNEDPDTPASSYKKLADKIVPDLTVVCNFEFQTKRKYYDRLLARFDSVDDVEMFAKMKSKKSRPYEMFSVTKNLSGDPLGEYYVYVVLNPNVLKMRVKIKKKLQSEIAADWVNLVIYGLRPCWLRLTKRF